VTKYGLYGIVGKINELDQAVVLPTNDNYYNLYDHSMCLLKCSLTKGLKFLSQEGTRQHE